jgi:hypothetical protein
MDAQRRTGFGQEATFDATVYIVNNRPAARAGRSRSEPSPVHLLRIAFLPRLYVKVRPLALPAPGFFGVHARYRKYAIRLESTFEQGLQAKG